MAGEVPPAEPNGAPRLAQPPPPGILVPVPTFFARKTAANYDPVALPLDLDAQTGHAVYLAQAGIVGLVLLGSTGEAVYLRETERFSEFGRLPPCRVGEKRSRAKDGAVVKKKRSFTL
jgi:hypothetical protein